MGCLTEEIKMKDCKKCHVEFPATAEYWHKDKLGKNGLHSNCKKCRNKKNETYRMNNHDSIVKNRIENKEYHRKYSKEYKLKNKNKINLINERYRKQNRETLRERHRVWRYENAERYNERYREYYKENKSKVRQRKVFLYKENIEEMRKKGRMRTQKYLATKEGLENSLKKEQWELTLDYFNESCAYCGIKRNDLIKNTGVDLNQEHLIPLSKGGGYTFENIIPACRSCNSSKSNRDFLFWYRNQDYYSEQRENKILGFLDYKNKKK